MICKDIEKNIVDKKGEPFIETPKNVYKYNI